MGWRRYKFILMSMYIDTLAACTIYLFLIFLSAIILQEAHKLVANSAGPVEASGLLRVDISTYYALHGEWPKDVAAIQTLFPEREEIYKMYRHGDGWRKHHDISNGAINTTDNRDNGIITLHPAVTSDDPFGPVIWVAGNQGRKDGWTIIGDDHTTVEGRYISRYLK